MIAVPSMLIVAPNGTVNDATELLTPKRWVLVRNVTGIVAFELAVLKAKNCTLRIFRKNIAGLRPEKICRVIINVMNRWNINAPTRTKQ